MLRSLIIPTQLPMSYLHWPAGSDEQPDIHNRKLVLFLHGYTDSAKSFLKKAWPERATDYNVLAPNGPFPVPVKTDEGYKAAYSWYFVDDSKKVQPNAIIPPSICIEMLTYLIKNLGYEHHEKVIVGFSQGGFLAPRLALNLKNVRRIIGVGTGYQNEDYQKIPKLKVDAIHGDQDPIVPLKKSKSGLSSLIGFQTEFFEVKGLAHTLNDEARKILQLRVSMGFD